MTTPAMFQNPQQESMVSSNIYLSSNNVSPSGVKTQSNFPLKDITRTSHGQQELTGAPSSGQDRTEDNYQSQQQFSKIKAGFYDLGGRMPKRPVSSLAKRH